MPREKSSKGGGAAAVAADASGQAKSSLTTNCLVCGGASAAHTHYGAVCCYSCRAFFRRGIKRNFSCVRGDNKCQVNSITRTNCKRCRYERCLAVGMKPSLVDACLRRKGDPPEQPQQQILIQEEEQAVRMIDQNGRLIDPNLRFVDQNGQIVSQPGLVIDQNGQIYDQGGQMLDHGGAVLAEDGQHLLESQGEQAVDQGQVEIPIGTQSKIDGSLLLQALEGRKKVLLELRDRDGDQSSEQELTQIAEGDSVQIPPGAQPVRQQTYYIFNPHSQTFEPVTIAEFMEQPVAEEVVVAQDNQAHEEITGELKQDLLADQCISERSGGEEIILPENSHEVGVPKMNGVQFDSRNEDHRIIQEYLRLQQERNQWEVKRGSQQHQKPDDERTDERQGDPVGSAAQEDTEDYSEAIMEDEDEDTQDDEPEDIYINPPEKDFDIEDLVDMEFEEELQRRKNDGDSETIVPDRIQDSRNDISKKPSLYRKPMPNLVPVKGVPSGKPVLQNRFGNSAGGIGSSSAPNNEITLQKSSGRENVPVSVKNNTPDSFGRVVRNVRAVRSPFYLPKRSPEKMNSHHHHHHHHPLRGAEELVVHGVVKLRSESNTSTSSNLISNRTNTSASSLGPSQSSSSPYPVFGRTIEAIVNNLQMNQKMSPILSSPLSSNNILGTPRFSPVTPFASTPPVTSTPSGCSAPRLVRTTPVTSTYLTPQKVPVIVSAPRHPNHVITPLAPSRTADQPLKRRRQDVIRSPVPIKKRRTSDFPVSTAFPGKFKVPYLSFTVEEEFLMHQLVEGYDMFVDQIQRSLVNMEPELMIWIYKSAMHPCNTLSESKLTRLMDGYKKTFAHHASCLIPDGLGKLSNGFLSSAYDYSQGALNALDIAYWFAHSDAPSMYMQEVAGGEHCSQYMKNWFLENIPEMVSAPAVSFNNCAWFQPPWCESKEDEKFFKSTLDEMGQILKGDRKLHSAVNLLTTISQTKESPYFKSKNIRRLYKSIFTLIWRYLEHAGHRNVSEVANRINSLIIKLHRCGDIFERGIRVE